MLNINDIKKRKTEPCEIKDIRQIIKEKFSNLDFIPETHEYFLHGKNGSVKKMNSVSSICHQFEPYVDWETILERKSLKLGVNKEKLRREWEENNITATSNGSLTHLFAEAYMYFFMGDVESMPELIKKTQFEKGFLIPYGNKQQAIAKYYEDLFYVDNFYPIMPEAQIYIDSENNPYGIHTDIAGTFDALFAFKDKDGNIKLSVRDWKTNKSLENSFNQQNKNTLLKPFNTTEFIDQPLSLYTLQLSLYQLGIEQINYEVCDRKLLWLTDDGDYHKINVKNVTQELIKSL